MKGECFPSLNSLPVSMHLVSVELQIPVSSIWLRWDHMAEVHFGATAVGWKPPHLWNTKHWFATESPA